MAELYSQYASGTQFTAGAIVGSATGVSGLNPIVDRLNSITTSDNLVTGSLISGTNTNFYAGSIGGEPLYNNNLKTHRLSPYISPAWESSVEQIIILDTSSGTNVDYVTKSNRFQMDSSIFAQNYGSSKASGVYWVAYSGVGGNFKTGSIVGTGENYHGIDLKISSTIFNNSMIQLRAFGESNEFKSAIYLGHENLNNPGSLYIIGSSLGSSMSWTINTYAYD